jgi:glycosyltransferase involved in cell wall biosynthesis
MSIGCKIVASRTAPVQEVIEDKKQGLLVDFFSKSELVEAVSHILAQPDAFTTMGKAARQRVVQQYDFEKVCLPQQLGLMQQKKSGVDSAIISV